MTALSALITIAVILAVTAILLALMQMQEPTPLVVSAVMSGIAAIGGIAAALLGKDK